MGITAPVVMPSPAVNGPEDDVQQSSGRMTAGIDGERALTPKTRGTLAAEIQRSWLRLCSVLR